MDALPICALVLSFFALLAFLATMSAWGWPGQRRGRCARCERREEQNTEAKDPAYRYNSSQFND